MKVALIHDWLVGDSPEEGVLKVMLELFPKADLFTLAFDPSKHAGIFMDSRVTTSPLQRLPGGLSHPLGYAPFFPSWMGSFDLSGYHLVVSSSLLCAKWAAVPPGLPHVCYCHSPGDRLWDRGPGRTWGERVFGAYLRGRDLDSNRTVTKFLAPSNHVGKLIRERYGMESEVLPPPVEMGRTQLKSGPGGYYLVVSDLNREGRVDWAVAACASLGENLVVVGEGPERKRLESGSGPKVTFRGRLGESEVRGLHLRAKALICPAPGNFPYEAAEALASGCPVVSIAGGGAAELLEDGVTGTLAREASPEGLVEALGRFSALAPLPPEALRKTAMRFSSAQFTLKAQLLFRRLYNLPVGS